MLIPQGSPFLHAAFYVLPALVAAGWVFLLSQARRAWAVPALFGLLLWIGGTGALAASGRLADFSAMPPPLMVVMVVTVALTLALAFSRVGTRLATQLPLWMLVGSQAFRFPLELAMHGAADEGVMPRQMTYDGCNLDILTGITALVLGIALYRGTVPPAVVKAWNLMGTLLLLAIMSIAIVSTPVPFRLFLNDPPNVWVTHAPFVWLPTLMVPFALFVHALLWRRLAVGHPS